MAAARHRSGSLPLLVAHGYVLAFIFCAFHETAHRTAFRTRWLNAAVGTLAGFLTFWPYRNYRVYHWEHHRHTQDPARDPELLFPKPASVGAYLLVLTGIPNAIRRIGRHSAARRGPRRPALDGARGASPARSSRRGPISRSIRGGGRGLALAGSPHRAPASGSRRGWSARRSCGPYLLAEHTACATTRDCLENTRTTLTLALVRLFAWNMPYHAEHHAYPAVPFTRCPGCTGACGAVSSHLEPGYVAATVKVNRHLFARARGPRRSSPAASPRILPHPG